MKASDYIARFLEKQGVHHVFEVVGGTIIHLIDSMREGKPSLISMHHEQAAAFAADAYGRMTGKPGVAMGTSGPGATNLLTGIGSSYFDSSPTIFITGQVNRHEQRGDRAIRQLGFQETDIVPMVTPITKAAWLVNEHERIPELMSESFRIATGGRPGPVLLDIPMDVQRENLNVEEPKQALAFLDLPRPNPAQIEEVLIALSKAKRPLILAGAGVRAAGAVDAFRRFVDTTKIPVVHSLLAVDVLPSSHPQRVGLIGTYGNRWANTALGESDFIFVVGSRLDIRQTGADVKFFKADRTIVHVDCEAGELNNRVPGCIPVLSHLFPFFEAAAELACDIAFGNYAGWSTQIDSLRQQWPDTAEQVNLNGINPNSLMRAISQAAGEAAAYCVDVGQHQMWAAQSLIMHENQRFLTSGGMGSMGFALPAGIGATFAAGKRPVVVIAGDGGFQFNIQELQTVRRNSLPLKMVVVNNHCHGMVRQFQESYFEARYQSTMWGYSEPNFARIAEAYGIRSLSIQDPAQVHTAVNDLWADPTEPFLLEAVVDYKANAYPKIAFGKPLTEMEPHAVPIAMEAT